MKLKKGDNIMVIAGKDKGKQGIISRVLPKDGKIIVTGVNIAKKHLKPSRKNPRGGIVSIPAAINASNAILVCPHCGKPTRIAAKITAKTKERVCRNCTGNLDTAVKEKNVKA